jgi:hypothetical protein
MDEEVGALQPCFTWDVGGMRYSVSVGGVKQLLLSIISGGVEGMYVVSVGMSISTNTVWEIIAIIDDISSNIP